MDFIDNSGQTRLSGTLVGSTEPYDGASSFQEVGVDLSVESGAGKDVATGTSFLGPIMGNLIGDALTKTGNYLGGLIGAFSVTGSNGTHYPSGAVLAQITDGVTDADGAVVAYIDGDSAQTNAGAAFKVRNNNSNAASGFGFGLDLQDAAHDGYQPVDAAFYTSAPLRLVGDVCLLVGSGNPVNGTTGANVCGPGSLFFDVAVTTKAVYVNTNTKASPTWTALY